MSFKKDLKRAAVNGATCVHDKIEGWSSQFGGALYVPDESGFSRPAASFRALASCANPACNRVETVEQASGKCGVAGRFKRCQMCLTKYCSVECQRAHWKKHKEFCKSPLAYESWISYMYDSMSMADRMNDLLHPSTDSYMASVEKLMGSEKFEKFLQHIGETRESLDAALRSTSPELE